jgi:hypothetical protein
MSQPLQAEQVSGLEALIRRLIRQEAQELGTEGDAIDAVGSDGKLNKVPKHSTWTTPSAYPTVLKAEDGTTYILISATSGGLTVSSTAGTVQITPTSVVVNFAGGSSVNIVRGEGIHVYNATTGKDCYLQLSQVTADMSIREIDVCDGGTAKKMLVLASEPYEP